MKYLTQTIYGLNLVCLLGLLLRTSATYEQKLLILSIVLQAVIALNHRYVQKVSCILPFALLVLSAIAVYPLAKIHEFSHLSVVITVFNVLVIHYLIFESLVQQELTRISRILSIIGYLITTVLGLVLFIHSFSLSTLLFVLSLYLSFVVSYIPPKDAFYKKAGVLTVVSIHTVLWMIFLFFQKIF